jgi:hypothetical protein
MKLSLIILFACLLYLTGYHGCAGGTETGNPTAGGTETGNPTLAKAFGILVDTAGRPQSDADVRLLPSGYNPVFQSIPADSLAALTDTNGYYEFEDLAAGTYTMTAKHPISGLKTIHSAIAVKDSGDHYLGVDTMIPPGVINAEISPSAFSDNSYLFVPGTDIYIYVPAPGTLFVDSVPAGFVDLLLYNFSADDTLLINDQFKDIQVNTEDTTVVTDTGTTLQGVRIWGNGLSIEYTKFEFYTLDFFGIPWTFVLGANGPDTMLINTFYMLPENTPIPLSDTTVQVAASLDSVRYASYNMEIDSLNPTGYISGTITFTAFDTAMTIAGEFSSGATLLGVNMADSSTFQLSITGSFTATKIAPPQ